MTPQTPTLSDWAAHFCAIAQDADASSDIDGALRLSPAFIAWRTNSLPVRKHAQTPDQMLWHALCNPESAPDDLLSRFRQPGVERTAADRGSLLPMSAHLAIEVWTETEFSALHALTRFAQILNRPDLDRLANEIARFHVQMTQPDNATNRPWCVHLFARLASKGDEDARLYAETLVHNAMMCVHEDPLAAQVLLDGAECLMGQLPPREDASG